MSSKAEKRIRKHLRKELKGQVVIQARWKFPWSLLPKRKKGWNTIPMFPKRQYRFEFRLLDSIEMKTGSAVVGKR